MTDDTNFEPFRRALPELLSTDRGAFVAFSGGHLIDRDADEFSLAERVAREHPCEPILIQKVVESVLVDVQIDTPEFDLIDDALHSQRVPLEQRIRDALADPGQATKPGTIPSSDAED